jgi:anhydro-N-acetylmuramic acid kinase
MSGTSMDAINAALVDFTKGVTLLAHHSQAIPTKLKNKLQTLALPGNNEIDLLGQTDVELGKLFAKAVEKLLRKAKLNPRDIRAIGSHGQTVRHRPTLSNPFTLQIGDPNTIASVTHITTVADFRRKDLALGGQGAPLVPAFHDESLRYKKTDRIVINIGGIANITVLSKNLRLPVIGFDTGPGNRLLDDWIAQHQRRAYDKNGAWARTGTLNHPLLKKLLNDPFFKKRPPKSTGREYFNLEWLRTFSLSEIPPADVQRTLLEFTAQSIVNAIKNFTPVKKGEIIICGGGTHNLFLIERIAALTADFSVLSSADLGIGPDWVEAMAFAWLAKRTLNKKSGNLPSVTGAKRETILGAIYYA